MIQLPDGLRIVHIPHGRGQNVHVLIQELIQFPGPGADGEYALAPIERFLLIGDFARLIELQVPVAHQLRMHTQILKIRFRNKPPQGIWHTADTDLQRDPVVEVGENIGRDLLINLAGAAAGSQADVLVALHYTIHLGDVDVIPL